MRDVETGELFRRRTRKAVAVAILLVATATAVVLIATATGAGIATTGDFGDAFDSFEIQFDSASPEAPPDVNLAWQLNETGSGEDVEHVKIAVENESGQPINLFKPGETDVPNPFVVSEREGPDGPDVTVVDIGDVELTLKIPAGHCDRVDEVEVVALDSDGENVTEPIRRNASCSPEDSPEEDDPEEDGPEEDGPEEDDPEESPYFAVTIDDYDTNVTAGETLNVSATVENTGNRTGTQNVTLTDFDGDVVDTNESLTLSSNESAELALAWSTNETDVDSGNVSVHTANETASAHVDIKLDESDESSHFAVTIDDYDESVTAGETLNVSATVENTGTIEDTQDVRFLIDGELLEISENRTLAPDENESVAFTYETNQSDVPDFELAVETDDDSATRTVDVYELEDDPEEDDSGEDDPEKSPYFAVEIDNYDTNVTAGETLNVSATVENTGNRTGTQNVTLTDFDGDVVDTRESLTLSSNESAELALAWSTNETDVGSGNVSVHTANETASAHPEIVDTDESPDDDDTEGTAYFAVTIDNYDSNVTAGQTVDINATVENTGDREDSQDVRFLVDGELLEISENRTLAPDENESVAFTYETNQSDVGDLELTVETDDDVVNRTVTVYEPAFFAVEIDDYDESVTAGETIDVIVTVENTGDRTDTQNVTLTDFDGDVVDTNESLTLSPNESAKLALAWSTDEADAGIGTQLIGSSDANDGNVTVHTANDTDSAFVEITQPDDSDDDSDDSTGDSDDDSDERDDDADDERDEDSDERDEDSDERDEDSDERDEDSDERDEDSDERDDTDERDDEAIVDIDDFVDLGDGGEVETSETAAAEEDSLGAADEDEDTSSIVVSPVVGWLLLVPLLFARGWSFEQM